MRGNTVFKQYDALDTHNYQFILLGTYFRNRFYKLRKDRYIFCKRYYCKRTNSTRKRTLI